jgi:hypothetical protein
MLARGCLVLRPPLDGWGARYEQNHPPMTRDALHAGVLLAAFALLVTMHVTLAIGLLRRSPWWRAPVGFVVPPLAVWWGWQAKMRVRSALWGVAAVVYGAALVGAFR